MGIGVERACSMMTNNVLGSGEFGLKVVGIGLQKTDELVSYHELFQTLFSGRNVNAVYTEYYPVAHRPTLSA